MPSDQTRNFDEILEGYKGPVMQQGRVILDRDFNALRETLDANITADALHMIGPAGTPDDGFAISLPVSSPPGPPRWTPPAPLPAPGPAAFDDFLISPGTMYVGGQRVAFPASDLNPAAYTYSYFDQPDWINPSDPAAGLPPTLPAQEFVYLHVSEQEISAVEDPDLLDVALGGPDTTQRLRLVRRIRRLGVDGSLCAAALDQACMAWAGKGLVFNPDTMRLIPAATVQVGFMQTQTTADPCDPVTQGGYLGADNQLIRVQIHQAPDGTYRLLWGYDNASFVYRVTPGPDGSTLTLQQSPVDAFHRPKSGQVVEILPTAAVLESDPDGLNPSAGPATVRCVAEAYGDTYAIAQDYDPSAGTLSLGAPLLAGTAPGTPLFARIWQAELPLNAAGDTVELVSTVNGTTATTGLQLTVAFPAGGVPPAGAYWMIAVRPSTPQAIYPARFLLGPQLPDGPRQWVCPLAVIDWTGGGGSPPGAATVTDCRRHFDNLVTRTEVEDLIDEVIRYDSSGQSVVLNDGDTVAGSDLAFGLQILLREEIDPATATVGSCFASLEIPFIGPDKTVVGFQPVVLAAGVAAQNATTLAWTPTANAGRYLTGQLPDVPTTGSFAADWALFPSQADWEYTVAGAEANISVNTPPPAAGYLAINGQLLPTNATNLKMTVTPQALNKPTTVGLLFNYTSPSDFWALTFTSSSTGGFSGSTGNPTSLALTHYLNGSAQSAAPSTGQIIFGGLVSLDLNINALRASLAFTAALTSRDPLGHLAVTNYIITFPVQTTPATLPASAVFNRVESTVSLDALAHPPAAATTVTPASTLHLAAETRLGVSRAALPAETTAITNANLDHLATVIQPVKPIPPVLKNLPPVILEPPVILPLQRLQAGTQVGLSTDFVGKTDFSLLQLSYASSAQPQVLLPAAGAGRLLCRLTVKRDLLTPADVQGNVATGSRPDFSRWFWVTPIPAGSGHYYYTSGSAAGSGGSGIGAGGLVIHK